MQSGESSLGQLLYVEDFDGDLEVFTTSTIDSQGANLIYLARSTNIHIHNFTVTSVLVHPAVESIGTAIAIVNSTDILIEDVIISNVQNDLGRGAIGIVGSVNTTIRNCDFINTRAFLGSSLWCGDGSIGTIVENATMTQQRTTASAFLIVPIYSDSTCESNVWFPPTPCEVDCSSCPGGVCMPQGLEYEADGCYCYCTGDDQFPCSSSPRSLSSSVSVSTTASVSPTVSLSGSQSQSAKVNDEDSGSLLWLWATILGLGIAVLVIVLIVAILLYLRYNKTRYNYVIE